MSSGATNVTSAGNVNNAGAGPPRTAAVGRCPLCSREASSKLFSCPDRVHHTPGEYHYRRCSVCGTVFQDPRVVAEDLSLCYPDKYYTHESRWRLDSTSVNNLLAARAISDSTARNIRERLRRSIVSAVRNERLPGFWGACGSICARSRRLRERAFFDRGPDYLLMRTPQWPKALDIGCGAGHNLIILQRLGWEVEGVEWDSGAAEVARSQSDRPVHVGDFRKVELPTSSYGLILMNHVFEHIDDPISALHRVWELLAAEGRVVIAYPNPQSLGARVFRDSWYPWEVPRHLVIPPVRALAAAARTVGLKPIESRTETANAAYFFAFSRSLQAGRQVDEYHADITRRDLWLRCFEQALTLVGFNVGEEIRIVLRKEPG